MTNRPTEHEDNDIPIVQTTAETAQTVQVTVDAATGKVETAPLPDIEGYYVEYVWPDQGDGR